MNYFLFEDDRLKLNLVFKDNEIQRFKELWKDGMSLQNIAKEMKRKPSEIVLLIIDRVEVGDIKRRRTGIFGL